MKNFQNNFTTIEQSKRLLELGVPADSADCYIQISECVKYNFDKKHEEIYKKCEYGVIGGSGIFGSEIPARLYLSDGSPEYLPCWSIGRLIEIYVKAKGLDYMSIDITPNSNLIEELIYKYKMSLGIMDFSKLEN